MTRKDPFSLPAHYYVLFLVILSVPTSVGYMVWEAQTTDITVLTIEGAPEDIVFIADPHLRDSNMEHTRKVIDEINALHPSVVLIGGDFVEGDETDFHLQQVWSEIEAPVYAILGNHDYKVGIGGTDGIEKCMGVSEANICEHCYDVSCLQDESIDIGFANALEEELERNGVQVLRNEVVELDINGEKLVLVGLDDGWAGMANPPEVPQTEAFTIYMIHEPGCRANWDCDLILAGHLHGGQYLSPVVQILNEYDIIEVSGLKGEDSESTPCYITRGIGGGGFSVDLRFNAPPEIVIINPSTPLA
jgi:predicted MPP superfamily phosphohydrolase